MVCLICICCFCPGALLSGDQQWRFSGEYEPFPTKPYYYTRPQSHSRLGLKPIFETGGRVSVDEVLAPLKGMAKLPLTLVHSGFHPRVSGMWKDHPGNLMQLGCLWDVLTKYWLYRWLISYLNAPEQGVLFWGKGQNVSCWTQVHSLQRMEAVWPNGQSPGVGIGRPGFHS